LDDWLADDPWSLFTRCSFRKTLISNHVLDIVEKTVKPGGSPLIEKAVGQIWKAAIVTGRLFTIMQAAFSTVQN
jgi:hypothetical protein